jgi:electron transfer flavoprotein beta subunit
MNVLILAAGVADPKWPLPAQPDASALAQHAQRCTIPSPFDEAALEVALKLRDADPAVRVHTLVAGPESLARKLAELRLDSVQRIDAGAVASWDSVALSDALAKAAAPLASESDLVLMGREFGDFDDGAVPPLVARALQLPHLSLALGASRQDGALWATRQRGGRIERVRLPGRALLSVTNDVQNRLRHPLLKNVMAARKLRIESIAAGPSQGTVQLAGMALAQPPRRAAACRMLTGSVDEQCEALAELLQEGAGA